MAGVVEPADAQQVLNFNDTLPREFLIFNSIECHDSRGFRFSSPHMHFVADDARTEPIFSSNGTGFMGYESHRGFPILMERVGVETFSLHSLDAAEYFAPARPDFPNAEMLRITGFQEGGSIVTFTVDLDGVSDGQGGAADFEHVVLPDTFVNLRSVLFTGLRAGDLDGGVALDNIEYHVAVPDTLVPCVAVPAPPAIQIVSPPTGNVMGTVPIEAAVDASLGIASVQVQLDGVNFGAPLTVAPYVVSWDTTTVSDGSHTITVEGRDPANNVYTATRSVLVRNLPVGPESPHYLAFDGFDDHVEMPDAPALSFGTGAADTPFTAELWFRPTTMGLHQLLGKWGEGSQQEYRLNILNGALGIELRDESAQASAEAVTVGSYGGLIGSWHHLAVTYDGRGGPTAAHGLTIYIDGVAVPVFRDTNPAYVAMENLAAPLQVGRESLQWKQYAGDLDEIRLWGVQRTAEELQAAMGAELVGVNAGLLAYWRLNAGSGTFAGDELSSANGVLGLGPTWHPGGPMVIDVVPPDITNITTSNVTDTTVTISFETSEPSTARVFYSTTGACPCSDVIISTADVAHSVTLAGLIPDTLYSFYVQTTDAASNVQISAWHSVTTLVAGADTIVPVVTITQPAPGVVSGSVLVTATVIDAGVLRGQVLIDSVPLGDVIETPPPYSVAWDTTTVADGPHTITVQAEDAAGNVGVASVTVAVRNTPVVSLPHYLAFDGIDDYIAMPDVPSLSFGTGAADTPFTAELWFQPTAMGRHQLLGKWGDGSQQEYRLTVVDGTLRIELRDESAQASAAAVTVGAYGGLIGSWHHLAVTYDGRGGATAAHGLTIYVDGVAVPVFREIDSAYVAMENLTAPLQVGRESHQWKQYAGDLDEIRLWAVARTAAEIQAAMGAELTGAEPGLRAYWRLNDGSGLTANDDLGTAPGTLGLGPLWIAGGPISTDVVPPDITGIATSNVTDTTVTISFQTSEAATGRVAYSITGACPCVEVVTPAGTTHNVTLTGLTPDTLHFFYVQATDLAGNVQTSTWQSVATLSVPDVVAPVVTITQPAAGMARGSLLVTATATDARGVVAVQVLVDGSPLGDALTAPPYSVAWDSTTTGDGPHTITVRAEDAAGNVGVASVIVTVSNPPASLSHYLAFDGINDFLEMPDTPSLSFGTGAADTPFTAELWFQPTTMGRHQLLGKWGESNQQEYRFTIVSGTLRIELRDESAQASASAVTIATYGGLIGAWHHLAVTYDGRGGPTAADGLNIYIDGIAVPVFRETSPAYVAMENLTAPMQVARESLQWRQYRGGLDEIRLWGVVRTAAEIQAAMGHELTGNAPGLRAYWRLNDGSGLTATDDMGLAHGTLGLGTLWVAGGAIDLVPPTISGIASSNLTDTTVTISFQTNEAATGRVAYSTTGACPCIEVVTPVGTAHSVTLTDLAPDTLHSFYVEATDAAGNVQTSAWQSVTTLVAGADVVAPIVTITEPAPGIVSGPVLVGAIATDAVGVVSGQVLVNGIPLGDILAMPPPYSVAWDTTTVPDGPHTVTVRAQDAAGNVGVASVSVTVRNTPVGSVPHYLAFDGINDYLEMPDAPSLSFGSGIADTPFTAEMWLRPTTMGGRQQLIGKWGENSQQEYRFTISNGALSIVLRDESAQAHALAQTIATYNELAGSWHHVAVTYDGRGGPTAADGLTIYVDGVAVPVFRETRPAYVAMENLAAPLQVARESLQWKQYAGGLDEIRLWGVARTAAEIQAAMGAELTGTSPGLRAYWRLNDGFGLTAMDDLGTAPGTLGLGPLWIAGGAIVPDLAPPNIIGIATSDVTDTTVTISFQTSEVATGRVAYSTTGACPCLEVVTPAGTAHSVTLTGLTPDTLYSFYVEATDVASNVQTSAWQSVATRVAGADGIAPVVTITQPAVGVISGSVLVMATATDAVGVVSGQVLVNGIPLSDILATPPPYSVTFDTTMVPDGPHTITVQAEDAAGNVGVASVSVTVRNAPVGSVPHYLEFDGVNDYLEMPDAPSLSFGAGTADTPFTAELWFQATAMTRRQQLIGKWGDSSQQEYRLTISNGVLSIQLRDESAQAYALAATVGTYNGLAGSWHHLAVTYDGRGGPTAADGLTIYVDGVAVPVVRETSPGYVAMENLAAPLQVARESLQWRQYAGGLDEIRLWGVARTAAEIQAAMGVELTGAEPGLRAYWQLNDGSGLTAMDDLGTAPGTLGADPLWIAGGPIVP